ncbi:MAG TPA: ComEC/Rec2 family competence protein [Candidatus Paceibacterota bacterium]|nr:ComEC/Rec2 family competence protein [Candidatus Paceibacterota bacterium]
MAKRPKKNKLFTFFILLLFFVAILFWVENNRPTAQIKNPVAEKNLDKNEKENEEKNLIVYVLDVGQGDAFLIESPTGIQALVDTGPPNKILSQLASVVPPTDRSIDLVFISHPDQDHIGGILDVLENYSVGLIFESGVSVDSQTFQSFKNLIKEKNIKDLLAKRGTRVDIGDGAYIEILFPDRDVSNFETNEASIVMRIVYGENSIMFTGDAPVKTEEIILSENTAESLQSDILKVGHHGSKTSTSVDFLNAVKPEYAVISVGLKNKFGHPKQEILDLLANFKVQIFRTDELGQIEIKCDKINPCKINK